MISSSSLLCSLAWTTPWAIESMIQGTFRVLPPGPVWLVDYFCCWRNVEEFTRSFSTKVHRLRFSQFSTDFVIWNIFHKHVNQ
jgi:hypothetical protein